MGHACNSPTIGTFPVLFTSAVPACGGCSPIFTPSQGPGGFGAGSEGYGCMGNSLRGGYWSTTNETASMPNPPRTGGTPGIRREEPDVSALRERMIAAALQSFRTAMTTPEDNRSCLQPSGAGPRPEMGTSPKVSRLEQKAAFDSPCLARISNHDFTGEEWTSSPDRTTKLFAGADKASSRSFAQQGAEGKRCPVQEERLPEQHVPQLQV